MIRFLWVSKITNHVSASAQVKIHCSFISKHIKLSMQHNPRGQNNIIYFMYYIFLTDNAVITGKRYSAVSFVREDNIEANERIYSTRCSCSGIWVLWISPNILEMG